MEEFLASPQYGERWGRHWLDIVGYADSNGYFSADSKKFPAFSAAAEPIRQAIKKRETEKPAPLDRIAATFETTNTPPLHHLLTRGNHAKEGKEVGADDSLTDVAVTDANPIHELLS